MKTRALAVVGALVACACTPRACATSERAQGNAGPPDAARTEGPVPVRWGPTDGGARHPAVLLVYGAAGPDIFRDRPGYRSYPEALAAKGFVVHMPDYRATPLEPARAIVAAMTWLRAQPDVDPDRVGVLGFSRGGFLSVCAAPQMEPRPRAIVELYGGVLAACEANVARLPPTLILHGDKDPEVPVAEAYKLDRLLAASGVEHAIHVYPGQEHGFGGAARADSVERMVAFFEAHLVSP